MPCALALPNYPRSAGANPDAPVDEKGITGGTDPAPRGGRQSPRVQPARRRRQQGEAGRLHAAARSSSTSTRPHRRPDAPSRRATSATTWRELNDAGLDVVGISPDKPEKLAKFRDNEKLTFPLLSDPDRKVLTAWGAFGEKKMYGKTVQGVIRSTFVVDEKGKIEVAQYNIKATGHVAKLRRDLSV